MVISKCVFCGIEQEDYKGVYYIKNDGSVLYFSSSKCLKNHMKLRRDRRKTRWTEAFHVQREKRYQRMKISEEKSREEARRRQKEEKAKMTKRKTEKKKKSEERKEKAVEKKVTSSKIAKKAADSS